MCGIAGYVGTRQLEPERTRECLARMRRRGPDFAADAHFTTGAGTHVYLLNSRLSIVDLDTRANQPFHVGSMWMTYNGELYNHRELRRDLDSRGYRCRTLSDTEVFLAMLDAFGSEALDRCEGMWAFAVYDEQDGCVMFGRDRFGEKPLYTFRDASGLYFGSEPKFIAALLGRALEINDEHIRRFLVNGYKALYKSRDQFFAGLSELAPGTVLTIDASGREHVSTYWTPAFQPDESMTYDDAVTGARERLIRSVELRLRADVPLAFCMSGGVDSNALIAIASRTCGYDVHGFTAVNDDPRYDERELVAASVEELSIRHTAVPVRTERFLDDLRALVRYHDAPVYTISYFVHACVMRAVAEAGYRVAISGTGADELFTGYYDHHLAYLYEIRSDPSAHAAALAAWRESVQPSIRNPYLGNPDLFVAAPSFRDHIFFDASRFADYLSAPWAEAFSEDEYTRSLLRNRMLNEMFHEVVPVILHEDDLNAMCFSIENRSPFLDRALFEFCFRIPSRHLIRNGYAKAVLRDAVRGIAPEPVLASRRKVGFNASVLSLLDASVPAVRDWLLGDSPIFSIVRHDRIMSLLGRADPPNSDSKFLFSFVSAKMFLEECVAG